jgi:Cytochrome c oxidase caa3 assembly factor (Caa3_CtaG)
MLQHVLLGDAAPALALVALRGSLLFFVLPASVLRLLGHRRLLRGTLAFLLRPSVSLAVWALVIGACHLPAAYDYALGHQAVHDVEHLSFPRRWPAWAQLVNPLIVISFAPRSDSAAWSLSCCRPYGRRLRRGRFGNAPPTGRRRSPHGDDHSSPEAVSALPGLFDLGKRDGLGITRSSALDQLRHSPLPSARPVASLDYKGWSLY